MGIIAALFNPIIPVALDRKTWAIIDVAAGALMIVSIFFVREIEGEPPRKRAASQ